MVKQVKKPKVTSEEQKFRNELYPDVKTVKNKNILCTSCNGSLKELILKGKPKTHPFMDTLLCEKCNSFFGDGEFSVDEDGSDKYCRWCGQGGTLYLCSTCTAGFCKKCIKRNLPRAALKEVEEDDWQCFCCNVKPLYELRAHCWAANKFAAEFNEEGKKRRNKKSDDHDNSDNSEDSDEPSESRKKRREDSDIEDVGSEEEGEEETAPPRRGRKYKKVEREDMKTKRTGRRGRGQLKIYKNIVTKLNLTVKDALQMSDLFRKKMFDCSNKKINLQYLKNFKNVTQTCEKLDILLESVESISRKLRTSVKASLDEWRSELEEPDQNVKNEEDDKDETVINGVEDKSSMEDSKLTDDSKTKQEEASDESEHSKTIDQDGADSPKVQKEEIKKDDSDSDTEIKGNRHDKADDDDDEDEEEDENSKDTKIINNSEKAQRSDEDDKSPVASPSKKRKIDLSSDDEEGSSTKEVRESNKKQKEEEGDGDN